MGPGSRRRGDRWSSRRGTGWDSRPVCHVRRLADRPDSRGPTRPLGSESACPAPSFARLLGEPCSLVVDHVAAAHELGLVLVEVVGAHQQTRTARHGGLGGPAGAAAGAPVGGAKGPLLGAGGGGGSRHGAHAAEVCGAAAPAPRCRTVTGRARSSTGNEPLCPATITRTAPKSGLPTVATLPSASCRTLPAGSEATCEWLVRFRAPASSKVISRSASSPKDA